MKSSSKQLKQCDLIDHFLIEYSFLRQTKVQCNYMYMYSGVLSRAVAHNTC